MPARPEGAEARRGDTTRRIAWRDIGIHEQRAGVHVSCEKRRIARFLGSQTTDKLEDLMLIKSQLESQSCDMDNGLDRFLILIVSSLHSK
jgi:hypothetical protein